jgi:DNA-binding transcriptional MerR regulator
MSKQYLIKEFSQLTSVTVNALYHYDKIGLLKPERKNASGYRHYSENDMLRLQQITILKFLGSSLNEIKKIVLSPQIDMKSFLQRQVKLLTKKTDVSKNAAWLTEQILIQLEKDNTFNWEMVAKIIALTQMEETDERTWQKTYYTPSEYNELAQSTLQHSAEFWEQYMAKWEVLFKEVEGKLHTDPEGEVGMDIAKRWLDLLYEIPRSPELREKGWEAFQKGLVPQQTFAYKQEVVEYVSKAKTKYKLEKNQLVLEK